MGQYGKPFQPPGSKREIKRSSQSRRVKNQKKKETKIKKVSPKLPKIAATPKPTVFQEKTEFISLPTTSPLEAYKQTLFDSKINSEISLMSNEDSRNVIPNSELQVLETGKVINQFEQWRLIN
tara:strand:- start:1086 stop:1454 length:369 start_codon:yes stop_codon:yes gene_type:complete